MLAAQIRRTVPLQRRPPNNRLDRKPFATQAEIEGRSAAVIKAVEYTGEGRS